MVGLVEMLAEGEPLMARTMSAVRRYHEARDSSVACDVVEQMRNDAETLMRELNAFQVEVIERLKRESY